MTYLFPSITPRHSVLIATLTWSSISFYNFFCLFKSGEWASAFVGIILHTHSLHKQCLQKYAEQQCPFYFSSAECTAGSVAWQLLGCLGSTEVKILRWSSPWMWRGSWYNACYVMLDSTAGLQKGAHSRLAWVTCESFTNECHFSWKGTVGEIWRTRRLGLQNILCLPPHSVLGTEPRLDSYSEPRFFPLSFVN